jgi:hypothetical protein
MDGDGQNYSVFNSRMLVDTVGRMAREGFRVEGRRGILGR